MISKFFPLLFRILLDQFQHMLEIHAAVVTNRLALPSHKQQQKRNSLQLESNLVLGNVKYPENYISAILRLHVRGKLLILDVECIAFRTIEIKRSDEEHIINSLLIGQANLLLVGFIGEFLNIFL